MSSPTTNKMNLEMKCFLKILSLGSQCLQLKMIPTTEASTPYICVHCFRNYLLKNIYLSTPPVNMPPWRSMVQHTSKRERKRCGLLWTLCGADVNTNASWKWHRGILHDPV